MADDAKRDYRQAEALLLQIPKARSRLRQRLLLAAAMTRILSEQPIVVGGTAEEYWAGGEYHPTDLDLCPHPTRRDLAALRALGLRRSGRHWTRDDLPVAVEFPGSGDDIERTVPVKVGVVSILMISCEDLYLDRVRQATVSWPREDVSFDVALELALTNYITIDWDYIRGRLRTAVSSERTVGTLMASINRRVRTRARRGSLEVAARRRERIRKQGGAVIAADRAAHKSSKATMGRAPNRHLPRLAKKAVLTTLT